MRHRKPRKHVVSVHEPPGTPGKPQGARLVLAVAHRLLMFHYLLLHAATLIRDCDVEVRAPSRSDRPAYSCGAGPQILRPAIPLGR